MLEKSGSTHLCEQSVAHSLYALQYELKDCLLWIVGRKITVGKRWKSDEEMKFDNVEMVSKSGKPFTLRVPHTQRTDPSTFIVAAHKTGSTLLNRITTELSERGNLAHVNVELQMWRQSISAHDWPDEVYDLLERPGFIFDSFRSLQKLPQLVCFETSPKIFLTRDPRDVTVSFYFSALKSHTIPSAQGRVREDMLQARVTAAQFALETYVLEGEATRILRNMQRIGHYQKQSISAVYSVNHLVRQRQPLWPVYEPL